MVIAVLQNVGTILRHANAALQATHSKQVGVRLVFEAELLNRNTFDFCRSVTRCSHARVHPRSHRVKRMRPAANRSEESLARYPAVVDGLFE